MKKKCESSSAQMLCAVVVAVLYFILLLAVTIETMTTTVAAAGRRRRQQQQRQYDSCIMHASILRSARPLNISFTETVLRRVVPCINACLPACYVYLRVLDFLLNIDYYTATRARARFYARTHTQVNVHTAYG